MSDPLPSTDEAAPKRLPAKAREALERAGAALTRYGFLWSEDPDYSREYFYAQKYAAELGEHLSFAGYELDHQEQHNLFRVHRLDRGHHARLAREESEWLLLLALVRADQVHNTSDANTAAPEVTSGEIVQQYTSFMDRYKRKKSEGTRVLKRFVAMRLIYYLGPGALDINNPQGRYQLPPILGNILRASDLHRIVQQMNEALTARGAEAAADSDDVQDGVPDDEGDDAADMEDGE